MNLFSQVNKTTVNFDSTAIGKLIKLGEEKEIERVSYWDSIYSKIKLLTNVSQKASLLLELAEQYEYIGVYDNAILNQKIAIKNLLFAKNNKLIAPILKKIGTNYLSLSKFDLAQLYYEKALKLFSFYKDSLNTAACHANIGTSYYYRSNYPMAIDYKLKALHHYETMQDTSSMAIMFIDIGTIYQEENNLTKAKEFYQNALTFFENKKDTKGILRSYRRLGTIHRDLKNFDTALYFFNKALYSASSFNSKSNLSACYMGIGSVYADLKKLNESTTNYTSALKVLMEEGDKPNIAMCLFNLGSNYYELSKYNEAEKKLKEAIVVAKEVNGISVQNMSNELLSAIYKQKNNIELSYFHYKEFIGLRDSMYNEENTKKIIQSEMNYEFEKKELKSKLEQQQQLSKIQFENERKNTLKNIFLLVTIFVLVIGGIMGYVLHRNNKQKQRLREFEKNELKQKLLLSQMNPHFIFNSIDHIQSLIGKKDKEAISYLHKFSILTRQILEYSRETHISLEEEKQVIENYISIQQLLYDNNFTYQLTIANNIETEAYLIPPMLTQPFIENAIKHGLKDKKEQGKITIDFYLKEEKLFVEITDNGTGFINNGTSRTSVTSVSHKSLAMKITKERLGEFADNITMENVFSVNNEIAGAKIKFEIPYIYEK